MDRSALRLLRTKHVGLTLLLAFLFAEAAILRANMSEESTDLKEITFKMIKQQPEIIENFQATRFKWPAAHSSLEHSKEFPFEFRTMAHNEEEIMEEEKRESKDTLEKLMLELSYGRYEISDARYKEVYQEGREIYTSEIVRILYAQNRHHVGIAAGIKKFTKRGQATITQEESKLTLIPIFLGLRYLLKVYNFIPWIEIGADYYLYTEKSDIKTTSGSTFGYHVQGGLYLQIPKIDFIKLKIQARHSKAKTKENNVEVDLGGFEYSLGLAFCFNLF